MTAVTARMAHALSAGYARGVFVAIDHPDGTGYFWSGVGARQWNGHTWSGAGTLGAIGPVKHTSEVAVQDIMFTLSGIDPTILAGMNDDVRNLNGSVWLACFHPEDDSVIADPYQLIDSELDFQVYEVQSDGTATIQINAHAGFYTLDKSTEDAWTHENALLTDPAEIGFTMISALQNQNLQWVPVAA